MPGLITFTSNTQLNDQARAAAEAMQQRQAQPVITGLAGYVRACWEAARDAKQPIERKMLKALRQRIGQYEPDKLNAIKAAGGSEVFMMITETKCRGAESWLRDILLDEGKPPFALKPTAAPDMPDDVQQLVTEVIANKVLGIIQSGMPLDKMVMQQMQEQAQNDIKTAVMEEAVDRADAHAKVIEDQFHEGGMLSAFDQFLSDLTTYPVAVLKGPVVRRAKQLEWEKNAEGKFVAVVEDKFIPTFSRVDPFRFYPQPGVTRVAEGYVLEHHDLMRHDLAAMIGVPGYDDDAIRAILDEGPGQDWLWAGEYTKSELEQKHNIWRNQVDSYPALEFWGKVSGKMLVEWGMSPDEVPDTAKEYDANVWLINSYVIKATMNVNPTGEKPYKCTSFVRRPGSLWGSGIPELIEDIQSMCNGTARALMNNMGIASGPQVEVNVDRLAQGQKINKLIPWNIWQTTSDPMGNGRPAITFTQPDDRAQALMAVYERFARMADEHSGVPAYIYGDGQVGGAGRTASGLSMLMGSAGKGIRQVVMSIDFEVIGPLVTDQYNWNMEFYDDESIKGDCEIVPRGAVTLANRDQLNVRRVEFLQATGNPIDAQIIGPKGRASILREVAKGLSMPVDDIVPSDEELEIQAEMQRQQQMVQATQPGSPQEKAGGKAVDPAGNPQGGADSRTVSNTMTGAGA